MRVHCAVCPVKTTLKTPAKKNGQKLIYQLILLRLQGLNIDLLLNGSVGGSISD